MLEVVMGEEALRRGLTQYLNKHKFRNADTDDLWSALTESTNGSIEVKVKLLTPFLFFIIILFGPWLFFLGF